MESYGVSVWKTRVVRKGEVARLLGIGVACPPPPSAKLVHETRAVTDAEQNRSALTQRSPTAVHAAALLPLGERGTF